MMRFAALALLVIVPHLNGCLRQTVDERNDEQVKNAEQPKLQPSPSFSPSPNANPNVYNSPPPSSNSNLKPCNEFDTSSPSEWSYFTIHNFGLRGDGAGQGWFDASRRGASNGHTGVDILMEKNQQMCSPCNGRYLAGWDDNFGNWTQIICTLPGESGAASFLFAHLSRYSPHVQEQVNNKQKDFLPISRGKPFGYAGTSGNAGTSLTHTHVDAVIRKSLDDAESERHAGFQMQKLPSSSLLSRLFQSCVKQKNISFKITKSFNVGANVDPYLLLNCYAKIPALNRNLLQRTGYQKSLSWESVYDFD